MQGSKFGILVISSFAFILYISLLDDRIWGNFNVLIYQCLLLALLMYVWVSYLNPSHVYSISSNSFVQSGDVYRFLPSSATPIVGIEKIVYFTLLLGFVSLLAFDILNRNYYKVILYFIWWNTLLLSVLGIIFKYLGASKMLGVVTPPFGTERYFFSSFTYKNHWGCYVLLTFGVVGFLMEECKWRVSNYMKCLVLVSIAIFAISVYLSGSRSCSILITGLLIIFYLRFIFKTRWNSKFAQIFAGSFGLLFIIATIVLSFLSHKEVATEFLNSTKIYFEGYKRGDWGTRYYLSRDTFKMFAEQPIFGWGLGSFEFVFNYYKDGYFKGADHFKDHHYVYAHNDILQYLSELGVIGFGLLVALFIVPFWKRLSIFWISASEMWIIYCLVLVSLYSLFEFPLRTPSVSLLYTILFAGVLRASRINDS